MPTSAAEISDVVSQMPLGRTRDEELSGEERMRKTCFEEPK